MDWYVIIGFIVTWLLGLFGLGKAVKELKEAIAATSTVVTEASDVMTVMAEALEDGVITGDEIKAVIKEAGEVAEAGKVAGKEWQDFFNAIKAKINK